MELHLEDIDISVGDVSVRRSLYAKVPAMLRGWGDLSRKGFTTKIFKFDTGNSNTFLYEVTAERSYPYQRGYTKTEQVVIECRGLASDPYTALTNVTDILIEIEEDKRG